MSSCQYIVTMCWDITTACPNAALLLSHFSDLTCQEFFGGTGGGGGRGNQRVDNIQAIHDDIWQPRQTGKHWHASQCQHTHLTPSQIRNTDECANSERCVDAATISMSLTVAPLGYCYLLPPHAVIKVVKRV